MPKHEKGIEHPGYRARDKEVEEVIDLQHTLCTIHARMRARRSCPQWLLTDLSRAIRKVDCIIPVLVCYRDQLPQTLGTQTSGNLPEIG